MTYFNRGGGFGGDRPSYNNRGSDRGGDRPELFKAVCEECGKDCEVPFRPNGSRPVYCSSCFEARGGGNADRPARRYDRPTNDYPRRDFGGNRDTGAPQQQNYRDEFLALNRKIDRILELLAKKETPKDPFFEAILEAPKKVAKKAKKKVVEV